MLEIIGSNLCFTRYIARLVCGLQGGKGLYNITAVMKLPARAGLLCGGGLCVVAFAVDKAFYGSANFFSFNNRLLIIVGILFARKRLSLYEGWLCFFGDRFFRCQFFRDQFFRDQFFRGRLFRDQFFRDQSFGDRFFRDRLFRDRLFRDRRIGYGSLVVVSPGEDTAGLSGVSESELMVNVIEVSR